MARRRAASSQLRFLPDPFDIGMRFDVFSYLIDKKSMTELFLPLNPQLVVPMMGLEGMYGFIIFGKKIDGRGSIPAVKFFVFTPFSYAKGVPI